MKKRCFVIIVTCFCLTTIAKGQDTFSIVAVDTVTGEIGSAGASCIAGSIIISDIHPARGAIHTQAAYISPNQNTGYELMESELTSQEILDSLLRADYTKQPSIRQYGIVKLAGPIRAVGYSGDSCIDVKFHVTGKDYAIQGNILSGRGIIDSMEARFLRTKGPLGDRLMAALQGANIPGADTRCLANGTSSLSAFIRVAEFDDDFDRYDLDINVHETKPGVEPIDSLQKRYDAWKQTAAVAPRKNASTLFYPNPAHSQTQIRLPQQDLIGVSCTLTDSRGESLAPEIVQSGNEITIRRNSIPAGKYHCKIVRGKTILAEGAIVFE